MILYPNCKINLGLHVASKRADGFHDIETIFYPVFLRDALEFIVLPPDTNVGSESTDVENDVDFTTSGLRINGNATDNLCLKAYGLLKKDFPVLPNLKIHLHKAIPMGAGLGGGSADGAFMLKGLNEKFKLGLPDNQLIQYAVKLGSDCPFFIMNEPCLGKGRGEVLTPIKLDLSAFNLVLVNPGIHVNTGWAFSKLPLSESNNKTAANRLENIVAQPVETWKKDLINDFEIPVFNAHPEIADILDGLYAQGAVYAAMSGTGSTVFGIFYKNVKPVNIFPSTYLVIQLSL